MDIGKKKKKKKKPCRHDSWVPGTVLLGLSEKKKKKEKEEKKKMLHIIINSTGLLPSLIILRKNA